MKNRSIALFAVGACSFSAALAQQHPNVVIILTDQQRADICGREGFPLPVTPFADQMAQQGAWFNRAYTSAPASVPARTSLITGRFPSATHVRTNHNVIDAHYTQDLIQVAKTQGYSTALVGKNHCYLAPKDFDYWDEYFHWGKIKKETPKDKEFAHWLDQDAKGQWLEASPYAVEDQNPYRIVSSALSWVKQRGDDPFFLCISMAEPHNPYQVPEPYFSMFTPDNIPPARTNRSALAKKGEKYQTLAKLEDESCPNLQRDIPRLRANYMGMIRLIDDQTKRLVEGLRQMGKFDNTVFLILADHGDYCGEYGLIRKGAGVSDCLTRIPMIWFGAGVKAQPKVMEACVSITDVMPTLCTAMGADIPQGVQGRSLWPMLTGKSWPKKEFESILVQQGFGGKNFTADEPLTFEQEGAVTLGKTAWFDELNTWSQSGTMHAVRKGDWKLIMDSYGRGELYNLKNDPAEVNNLYGNKKYREQQCDMLHEFALWQMRSQDPLPQPRHRYKFKRNENNYHFE